MLALMLLSQTVVAREGDLYLFHNVYTKHLSDSGYYQRGEGNRDYEEDNNATGLRYKYSDHLSLGLGYAPDNSYNESSLIVATEYVWPISPHLELGGMVAAASGYERVRHNVNGWALQVGPLARVQKDWFALSAILINMDILVANVEFRLWQF